MKFGTIYRPCMKNKLVPMVDKREEKEEEEKGHSEGKWLAIWDMLSQYHYNWISKGEISRISI